MMEKEKAIAIVKVIDPPKLKLVSNAIMAFFQYLEVNPPDTKCELYKLESGK